MMTIDIVKHYWKDNKATWECSEKIDEYLFEYLKENYYKFVKEKPSLLEKDKYFIYFCYEEGRETGKNDNRKITNITFFIAPKEVKKELREEWCKKKYENCEIIIPENKKYIFLSLFVLIPIVLLAFNMDTIKGWFEDSNISKQEEIVEIPKPDYDQFVGIWNNQVQNYTDKKEFLLSRDSSDEVIDKLNSLISQSNDKNTSALDNYTQGDIKSYIHFKASNALSPTTTLDTNMTKEDIKKYLQNLTKERSISAIVKKILMMNDIDTWKESLHK